MIMISFKNKESKEHLLDKAKKLEAFAAEMVDCIEDSEDNTQDEYSERMYRHSSMSGRYGYRR